jgi:hypothetical protein
MLCFCPQVYNGFDAQVIPEHLFILRGGIIWERAANQFLISQRLGKQEMYLV